MDHEKMADAVTLAVPSLSEKASAETLPCAATSIGTSKHLTHTSVPKDFFLFPVPRYLRRSSEEPAQFTLWLNVVFAVATTFIVANIYWCQPILIELSESFNVSFDKVSNIPTLMQAGYATGLLFISPLGDVARRRPLILILSLIGTALTFGLAFTHNFIAFQTISFFLGVVTCVPQILIPLAADLAPPQRRATAISIVVSGLLLGILLARVVSGLIAQFVSWRIVYYVAIGLQTLVFLMLYFLIPDYPVQNTGISYVGILLSMAKFAVTEPLLIQSSLVCLASMACFTNFWVTLTFLLGGSPYNYSTLVIGLFGLIGMLGVVATPLLGRLIDDLVPWLATVIATIALIVFQAVQTGAGGIHIAAVIIVCFGIDVFRQMQQVSLTAAVFNIDPKARSRLNAVLIISVFIGQIMGTSVGTEVFVRYGWRPAAALSVAWSGFTLVLMFLRGPHCARYTWFGYEGGCEVRKSRLALVNVTPQAARTDEERGIDEQTLEDKSEKA